MPENNEKFTVEETNLMCIFDTAGRQRLISELTAAMPGFGDGELAEIAESALAKLEKMSGDGFDALTLYPVYDDYEESEA
jgi:hypothetical protein